MAIFWADGSGKGLGFVPSIEIEALQSPNPPTAAAFTVTFDEDTNPALVADIEQNFPLYSAPAGVLNKNGIPVVITAASALFALESTIEAGVSVANLDTFVVALWNGTATSAQVQKALAYVLMKLHAKGDL